MTTPQAQPAGAAAGVAAAAAAAAAPPAKKGLDDFLREFDAAPPAQPQPQPQPAPKSGAPDPAAEAVAALVRGEVDKAVAPIRGEVVQTRRDREMREIDGIVESVRGKSEFLKSVDPDVVFGFLQGLGAKDPRFRAAFLQRGQRPESWQQVLNAAADTLAEKLKPVAAAPSAEARAAVLAAARVSGAPPREGEKTPAEVHQMSDSQFRAYKRQIAAGARR